MSATLLIDSAVQICSAQQSILATTREPKNERGRPVMRTIDFHCSVDVFTAMQDPTKNRYQMLKCAVSARILATRHSSLKLET